MSMFAEASLPMPSEQRKKVLAEIAHEELVRLVYGPITTAEDYARLAELAEAAGVALADVLPASGEPGHDPRTHRPTTEAAPVPSAVADREAAAPEADQATGWDREPVGPEADLEELDGEELVRGYASDVAALRGWSWERAEQEVRRWAAAPHGARRARVLAFLVGDLFTGPDVGLMGLAA